MKDEYLMLRNEMLKDYDVVQNSRYILYITVVSVISFSVIQKIYFLFLLPYIIIIPTYLISVDYTLDMYRICTYLMVFLEGEDFNWENRQYMFNYIITNKISRRANFFHVPFVVSSVGCVALYYLFFDYSQGLSLHNFCMIIKIFLPIICFFIVMCIFLKYKNMETLQKRYIQSWQEVKIIENKF